MSALSRLIFRLRAGTSSRSRVIIIALAVAFIYLVANYSYLAPIPSKLIAYGHSEKATPTEGSLNSHVPVGSNEIRILLVSAMFPLKHSKHSKAEYEDWLSRFLGPITTDIYFYTPPDMEASVRATRGPGLNITVNTTYASPFDVPPLKGLEKTYAKIHKKDREKKKHSPELYAIWNAKPFLLDAAVNLLAREGHTYDFVFWTDAGSFREDHRYTSWPHGSRLQQIWEEGSKLASTDKTELVFFPIFGAASRSARHWKEDMGPVDDEFSEGSFFGGTPSAMSWWKEIFYKYHNYYLSLSYFVGKDQTIINALFLLYPERFITVWLNDPLAPAHKDVIPYFDAGYLGACGLEWYYYQFWFSDPHTQRAMQDLWMDNSRWSSWSWWKSRQKCRITRVLAMKTTLQRWFGKEWRPPSRTLEE